MLEVKHIYVIKTYLAFLCQKCTDKNNLKRQHDLQTLQYLRKIVVPKAAHTPAADRASVQMAAWLYTKTNCYCASTYAHAVKKQFGQYLGCYCHVQQQRTLQCLAPCFHSSSCGLAASGWFNSCLKLGFLLLSLQEEQLQMSCCIGCCVHIDTLTMSSCAFKHSKQSVVKDATSQLRSASMPYSIYASNISLRVRRRRNLHQNVFMIQPLLLLQLMCIAHAATPIHRLPPVTHAALHFLHIHCSCAGGPKVVHHLNMLCCYIPLPQTPEGHHTDVKFVIKL